MKILGIDPALTKTGWGVIEKKSDGTLSFIASGIIKTNAEQNIAARLMHLSDEIERVISIYNPHHAAIEETFLNKNPSSSLKLGHARGALIISCARNSVAVHEYAATLIKKSVVGVGRAEKHQIAMMVKILLPRADFKYDDESDALATAITHANHTR